MKKPVIWRGEERRIDNPPEWPPICFYTVIELFYLNSLEIMIFFRILWICEGFKYLVLQVLISILRLMFRVRNQNGGIDKNESTYAGPLEGLKIRGCHYYLAGIICLPWLICTDLPKARPAPPSRNDMPDMYRKITHSRFVYHWQRWQK